MSSSGTYGQGYQSTSTYGVTRQEGTSGTLTSGTSNVMGTSGTYGTGATYTSSSREGATYTGTSGRTYGATKDSGIIGQSGTSQQSGSNISGSSTSGYQSYYKKWFMWNSISYNYIYRVNE